MVNALANRDEVKPGQRTETFEEGALKNVIRASWEHDLAGIEKLRSKQMIAQLESHAHNMSSILNTHDYEFYAIPNILAHAKHMSRNDFSSYLSTMELIAHGYSGILDKELVSFILIGMSHKAKTSASLAKHYDKVMSDIDGRIDYYNRVIDGHTKVLGKINYALNMTQSSFLRFFFRGKIVKLRRLASMREGRIKRIASKRERYLRVKGRSSSKS